MKTSATPLPRCRAPKGAGSAGRFNISLLPAEREELQRLAAEDGRTMSAMARVLVLRGLAQSLHSKES